MNGAGHWTTRVTLTLLAGCAQLPPPSPPVPMVTVIEASVPKPNAFEAQRAAAIVRHLALVEGATRDGDLASAAAQWQILTLLAPDNDSYRHELAAMRARIAAEAKNQLHAGLAAMASGDLDRASQAMLRVLALDPTQTEAAATLREIDRRRYTRIQANRAAKARIEDQNAAPTPAQAADETGSGFNLEQALEMLRAGDAVGGIRDLKAFVDANPGDRVARQRIGAAVAERARMLEDRGSREQALRLYEQATQLAGNPDAIWAARAQSLRREISRDYYLKGSRVFRSNLTQAIAYFEISLRYDPTNTQSALKLEDARLARERLDAIDGARKR